jgi:phosphoribosylanthranilate isomerase
VLTQIHEVSTPGEARLISKFGVDHIGILIGNGEFPRELSIEVAAEVAAAVRPPLRVSALFLTADLSVIEKSACELCPAIVHLGERELVIWSTRRARLNLFEPTTYSCHSGRWCSN